MVVLPAATPVARPLLLMVATEVALEVQVTALVTFCLLPSLKVPVAVNCCWFPAAIDGLAGVTATDTRVGAVDGLNAAIMSVKESLDQVKLPAVGVADVCIQYSGHHCVVLAPSIKV